MTITNAWICQVKNRAVLPVFGNLIIRDEKIAGIQPKNFANYISQPGTNERDGFDAGGRVVTVPLVNFHDHFYSRLAKGLPISGPQENFVQILENLWWKLDMALDLNMVEASAKMASLESIRNGVTYIFDHHASPAATAGSLNKIAGALQNIGLRGVLCFETSDRNGPELADAALQENINFIHKNASSDLRGMLGLHALFTLNDETLGKAAEILKESNTGIHIHIAEDGHDPEFSKTKYGLSLAERLRKFGLLHRKSILVHGVHLTPKDYRIIAESDGALAYCPDSNLNNAVGIPAYAEAPPEIPILAGTDGMSATIARSLKQLFLLYRHQQNSFDTTFAWFQKIFYDQIAFVRQYFPDYPSLLANDRADFIIWDYVPPTPFSADNFWGHYIYGILERPVHSVVQNGGFLMKNFEIVAADEKQIAIEIFRQGEQLFKKIKTIYKNE
jgi:cytosine/adenosine deaminase-related metal-dependent hydrolase